MNIIEYRFCIDEVGRFYYETIYAKYVVYRFNTYSSKDVNPRWVEMDYVIEQYGNISDLIIMETYQ